MAKNQAAVELGRLGGSKKTEKKKGFAAMDRELVRAIARKRERAKRKAKRAAAKH